MTNALIEPPLPGKRDTQIVMRNGKFRINFDGPSKKDNTFIQIPLDPECQPEVIAKVIGIRPHGESPKIVFNRLLGIASLKKSQPEIHVRNIVVLDDLNGVLKQGNVILPISELRPRS
jgi:hypothetical protein